MTDTNPQESLEAEGMPELEDHPPGIDVETDEEGMVAPRDYPIAAGGDPAYPVTAAEERLPESVAERASREIPDVGEPTGRARAAGTPAVEQDTGGVRGRATGEASTEDDFDDDVDDGGQLVVGGFANPGAAVDRAVPVDEPEPPSVEEETVGLPSGDGAQPIEPSSGEGLDADDEATEIALLPEDHEAALSAEEAMVRVREDDDVR